jgi:multidrug efflux pump subunit AcrA (membrane-fusion protein)
MKLSVIEELTRASGIVIAVDRTQVIQSLYDGELEKVYFKEGDQVRKNEVLASLNNHNAKAHYQDELAKTMAIKATLMRLRAEIFNTPLVFGGEYLDWPIYISNQKALFKRRQTALRETISTQEKILTSIRSEISITRPLVINGDVGSLELLQLSRRELEITQQIADVKNKYFEDAQAEMTKSEVALASQEQVLSASKQSLVQTQIKSPMNGIVKNIKIHTNGAALRQGDVLMELVPVEGGLVVEAKLSPKDIAFVMPGMSATIKLDSYDYSIYGQAEGKVTYISPDALLDSNPASTTPDYYRVLISVSKLPEELVRGRKAKLQPGMTSQVQIKTGSRTILQYLTKPIFKTFSESMSER